MSCYWFHGATGKGTLEAKGVMGRDITGTLESLGRSMGYTTKKRSY
jgi:7-keto-8-aminopelargonate synthetase-like enzyme